MQRRALSSVDVTGAPARALALASLVFAVFTAVAARADEYVRPPEPEMRERAGFSFDLRSSVGMASAQFTESDRAVAEFGAVALGAAARFGWFWGHQILIGGELSGAWHHSVGRLTIVDPSFFNAMSIPEDASFSTVAPLGVFIEYYPSLASGVYLSVAGGVGVADLPSFDGVGRSGLLSTYSFEIGYELSGVAKVGPAPFLRYVRWAGEESPISSDHPDGVGADELVLGLRWSFWAPVWR